MAFSNLCAVSNCLESSPWTVSIHPLSHKLLRLQFNIQQLPKCNPVPLNALTVFTEGSGKTGRAVIVWQDGNGQWQSDVSIVKGSPQIVELAAVVRVFQKWNCSINIVTDSAYVAGVVSQIEASYLKEIEHESLFVLF